MGIDCPRCLILSSLFTGKRKNSRLTRVAHDSPYDWSCRGCGAEFYYAGGKLIRIHPLAKSRLDEQGADYLQFMFDQMLSVIRNGYVTDFSPYIRAQDILDDNDEPIGVCYYMPIEQQLIISSAVHSSYSPEYESSEPVSLLQRELAARGKGTPGPRYFYWS